MIRNFGFAAVIATSFLAGCASYNGRGLVPGQSTEAEVELLMGPSADRRAGRDGERVRYYSRLPYGREMYAARFGADGKLKALEQRLTEQYFSQLKPGVTRAEEVRDLLGPPHKAEPFPRMQREIWSYQWQGLTSWRLLLVYLSADNTVREIESVEDPEGVGAEGDGG
jgi:hypothetical protein